MQWIPPGASLINDKVLATNVAKLQFSFDAPSDPGIIHVNMAQLVPMDTSGKPGSIILITPSELTIRMIAS